MKKSELYDRREWLKVSGLAVGGLCLPNGILAAYNQSSGYKYHLASVPNTVSTLPENKSVPFDWPVAEIPVNGGSVQFSWNKKIKSKNQRIFFRLTSATDIREECTLKLLLAASQQEIGNLDIRFAHYMQPFEIVITQDQLQLIMKEGLAIKMIKGTKPFWFFVSVQNQQELPEAYLPHLLTADDSSNIDSWKKRLLSFSSLSTFGWMEGCVLDGISMVAANDKYARKILQLHLNKYFANNTLVYTNLNNVQSAEKISTVESILPFAMLASKNSEHAMLQTAIDFCTAHANKEGVVADDEGLNRRLKTEECYTISYPLAVLAKLLNRPDLEKMAIANLDARVKLLSDNNAIYQNGKELEKPGFANWARGVGWYLLGLAKTLAVLPLNDQTEPLRKAFQKGAEIALRYQMEGGLWSCFLHEPATGIETSGSASIAAAMAYGYSQKLLPVVYKEAAEKCLRKLREYYTPDGYLTGTAQVNKGGERLQRNGFRVISPYSLGFIGILEMSLLDNK